MKIFKVGDVVLNRTHNRTVKDRIQELIYSNGELIGYGLGERDADGDYKFVRITDSHLLEKVEQ